MKDRIKKDKKEPRVLKVTTVIVSFIVFGFYVFVWVGLPLLGIGDFDVTYFFFMFLTLIGGQVINTFVKANPEQPIPRKPTQQFTNLIKAVADVIATRLMKDIPAVTDLTTRLEDTVILSLRDAMGMEGVDQELIEEAKDYVFKRFRELNNNVESKTMD